MEETGGFPERRQGFGRDWTKGNVFRNLLMLSWPMFVGNIVMILGFTVDLIWVGKLGSVAIAGVGIGGIAMMLVITAIMGLMMGMRAMVARFMGAGDVRGANHVARQGFVISGAFAIAVAFIGIFLTESIIGLFDVEADVVAVGTAAGGVDLRLEDSPGASELALETVLEVGGSGTEGGEHRREKTCEPSGISVHT